MDFVQTAPETRRNYETRGWSLLPKLMSIEVADATLYAIQKELGGDWESYKGDYIRTFLTEKRAFECYSFDFTPMATLQWGLTPFICALTGKSLLPSHCYFRVYRGGDVCKIHSDTTDCQYAISLTLGYSDDLIWEFTIGEKRFDASKESPAEAAKREKTLKFYQLPLGVDDAILYNGIDFLHGRTRPNPNKWSAHIFFHWVDRIGPYAKRAFDGRAADVVRRAEFRFPDEDRPEKLNPNRAPISDSRGR